MALNDLGVPAEKIRLIFNAVDEPSEVPATFQSIFDYHNAAQHFELRPNAIIKNNELYGLLQASGKTIKAVLADETDFKEAMSQTENQEDILLLGRGLTTKRLAKGVKAELDAVFGVLFGCEA
jgi:hypothetical protein